MLEEFGSLAVYRSVTNAQAKGDEMLDFETFRNNALSHNRFWTETELKEGYEEYKEMMQCTI